MIDFLEVLFGFIGGVFGGMGMGGGTLLIPLLAMFLGMEQHLCQGINLLTFLIMAIFSCAIHFKHNLVDLKIVYPLALCGVVFSLLGAFLTSFVSSFLLKKSFGVFLVILGFYQLFDILLKFKKSSKKTAKKNN